MPKRPSLLFSLLLLLSNLTLQAQERTAYLIATTPGSTEAKAAALVTAAEANVRSFSLVHGFAANLTEDEVERLRRDPRVRYISLDVPVYLADQQIVGAVRAGNVSAVREDGLPQAIPWGIAAVRAPEAWGTTRGEGVRVGVIDTGVDPAHPDLQGRVAGGWDFVNRDTDPSDDNGHGTHVAGTIAANDDAWGVVGVAPSATIVPLKVLGPTGLGQAGSVIEALDWAARHQLDVVNLSLSFGPMPVPLLTEAFTRLEEAGVVAVAAAGNSGASQVEYPGAYPTVVAVGAVDRAKTIAKFSNRGSSLDVVAPGVEVLSTLPASLVVRSTLTVNGTAVTAFPLDHSRAGVAIGEIVDCGSGSPEEVPDRVRGKVALIKRGGTTFAEKTRAAVDKGAVAVIIYNHGNEAFRGSLGVASEDWPITVSVAGYESPILLQSVGRTARVTSETQDYGNLSGTSMASPHVAGVAALLCARFPEASPEQIREIVRHSVRDLGASGWDLEYGSGLVDAAIAVEEPPAAPSRRHGVRR